MAKKYKKSLTERLNNVLEKNVSRKMVSDEPLYFITRGTSITSQGSREALNRMNTMPSYVKATHWFDSFWFYISIDIRRDEDNVSELPFVSVSFFQESEEELKQLFRAEWDNFRQKEHPQPHWHLSSDIGRQTLADLETDEVKDDENPFAELERETDRVNIPKMHFAMAGNWDEGNRMDMIKNFSTEEKLAQWLNNLFDHVRQELSYAQ